MSGLAEPLYERFLPPHLRKALPANFGGVVALELGSASERAQAGASSVG